MTVPAREILWNVPWGEIIYPIAAIAVAFMIYAFYRHYRIWHLGKTDSRLKDSAVTRWKTFLQTTLVDFVLHRKFVGVADNVGHRPLKSRDLAPREFYPGVAHFLLAIGFALLLLGTALDVISHYIYDFIWGRMYFAHSLFTDIGGIMALVGLIMFTVRRYGQKPPRLDNKIGDLMALSMLAVIMVTGFVVEGLRIAANEIAVHPAWSRWSPGGYLLAEAFRGIDQGTLLVLHRSLWWFHSALVFGAFFYVAIYFNRLWHIILSPLNVFFRNLGPRGAMTSIDLEKAESFGVSRVEDYSWKHLLDLDACTRCGRCQDNCPAQLSGKPLNPKGVIQDLKTNFFDRAPSLLAARRAPKPALETDGGTPVASDDTEAAVTPAETPMIGGVVSTDAIWNCTTCYACQEVCPVWIEPMTKLGEMRRNLVLEQAAVPETGEGALRSIEDRGHPWRGTMLTRTSWMEGMDIKTLAEDSQADILFWVGCTEALEERSLKVARAIARLLQEADVKFGVLGAEESCCGDPARRLGNEYLYQMQAQKNIETLKGYNVKKIVTGCPHCYNTLKNEYPQFGGTFEVTHHTDFILSLIKSGQLKPATKASFTSVIASHDVSGRSNLQTPLAPASSSVPVAQASVPVSTPVITYHDACYLGRYNNIFEAPREILKTLTGAKLVEMKRSRERNFCCGAGGGHLWLEEQKVGERINVMRTDQALETRANIVATACPYCLQMFQDGIKSRTAEEKLQVMDIAELLEQRD